MNERVARRSFRDGKAIESVANKAKEGEESMKGGKFVLRWVGLCGFAMRSQ